MPAWLLPAIKAILPHVGTIVSAASPAFTRKNSAAVTDQSVLQQQITELQAAATANDAHIKELAAQIKSTVELLETGASVAESRHQRVMAFCTASIVLSLSALATALFVYLAR
jgi:hypothetical protein